MPISVIRKDYLLSEAFELTGRQLFGAEWTGNELTAAPVPSAAELRTRRAPHEEALAEIDAKLATIQKQIGITLSASKIQSLEGRRNTLFARRNKIGQQLNSLPEPTDTIEWLHSTFERKLKATNVLISALKRGQLNAHNGRNQPIDNLLWQGHPHFGFDMELSVVRMPRDRGKRFQAVRINEREFDSWLRTLAPLTPSAEQALPPIEQCRRLIRGWGGDGVQRKPKDAYRADAMTQIRGLSKRAFDSAWNQEAPEKWKDLGRRRWHKESPH